MTSSNARARYTPRFCLRPPPKGNETLRPIPVLTEPPSDLAQVVIPTVFPPRG